MHAIDHYLIINLKTVFIADEISKELIHYTINNPKNEISLISNIKTVNEIKNDTSLKIRNQYETFPYPSWVYCKSQPYKRSISQYLKI